MKLFIQGMGVVSAILFFIAGIQLISISAEYSAQSFYHGVGWMSFGLAVLDQLIKVNDLFG